MLGYHPKILIYAFSDKFPLITKFSPSKKILFFFTNLNLLFSKEIILLSSLLLIAILMRLLIKDLKKEDYLNYFK